MNKCRRDLWILIIELFVFAACMIYVVSAFGFIISLKIGMHQQSIQRKNALCSRVDIYEGHRRTGDYTLDQLKRYDFYCSDGNIYRLCLDETAESDLIEKGFTDEKLRSLEGSTLTIEFVSTRFLRLHDPFPLLSLGIDGTAIVSRHTVLVAVESSWNSIELIVILFGGFILLILLGMLTSDGIIHWKRKTKARRKKLRRKK